MQLLYLLILRCVFFSLIFMPLNLGHILQSKGNHNLIDNFFSFLVVTADWSLKCSKSAPSLCLHALCNVTLLTCHQTGGFPHALKMGWSHLYLFLKRALLVPYTFPFALTHFSLPDFQKQLHFFAPGPSPAAKAHFACCDGLKICSQILWPSSSPLECGPDFMTWLASIKWNVVEVTMWFWKLGHKRHCGHAWSWITHSGISHMSWGPWSGPVERHWGLQPKASTGWPTSWVGYLRSSMLSQAFR